MFRSLWIYVFALRKNKNVQIILFIYLFMQAVHLRFGFSFRFVSSPAGSLPSHGMSWLGFRLLPIVCLLDAQILLRRYAVQCPSSWVLGPFSGFSVGFALQFDSRRNETDNCMFWLRPAIVLFAPVQPRSSGLGLGLVLLAAAVHLWQYFHNFCIFFPPTSSPTVGACVNINFSRRFNPDYPLTVKFFTQKLCLLASQPCVCLWLFGWDSVDFQSLNPFFLSLAALSLPIPGLSSVCVLRER